MNLISQITAPSSLSVAEDKLLYRKITWRLMPLLFACYVFNYLDRTNIGYAQLQMKEHLGFGDAVFGLGAGVFFVGYALFEVPSNMMLARVGARSTLLRIMALWGLTSASMMFVTTVNQFYVVRFLLGVFEAGFAPGVLYYLTLWYPPQRRAQATALFFMGYAAAPIIAGPIAGLTMTYLDNVQELRGWQWLFLLEGIPSVLLGLTAFFYLDNGPEQAQWLTPREKTRLSSALQLAKSTATGEQRSTVGSAMRDGRIWLLGLMSFLIILGIYALSFWQPTMLKSMGLTVLEIGFYSIVPAVAGMVATILIGRRSDRLNERRWHFAVTAVAGAAGLSLTTIFMHNAPLAVVCLAFASAGVSCAFAILWTVPGIFLSKHAAAAGIAFITTVGGCAGVVAPALVGYIKTVTGGFTMSLYLLSGALVLSALLMLLVFPKRTFSQNA